MKIEAKLHQQKDTDNNNTSKRDLIYKSNNGEKEEDAVNLGNPWFL